MKAKTMAKIVIEEKTKEESTLLGNIQTLLNETGELVERYSKQLDQKKESEKILLGWRENLERCSTAPSRNLEKAVHERLFAREAIEVCGVYVDFDTIELRSTEQELEKKVESLRSAHNESVEKLVKLMQRKLYWKYSDALGNDRNSERLDEACVKKVNGDREVAGLRFRLTAHWPYVRQTGQELISTFREIGAKFTELGKTMKAHSDLFTDVPQDFPPEQYWKPPVPASGLPMPVDGKDPTFVGGGSEGKVSVYDSGRAENEPGTIQVSIKGID